MQWLAYFLIGLVFSLLPLAANANEAAGLKMYNEELEKFSQAPGIATDIFTDINGITARTHVVQYFLNDTDSWQEGVYTYPLPDSASVDKLVMIIGDRRVLGFVAQKDKAKKIYEEAKKQGKATGLVEQHRPNLFRNSVANIPPRSLVAIELAYQHDVKIDNRQFTMRLPMAVTPRFDNFEPENLMQFPSNEVSHTQISELQERLELFDFQSGNNPVRIQIKMNSGFAAENIKCASHAIKVDHLDEANFKIQTVKNILPGEQDLILNWNAPDSDDVLSFVHVEEIDDEVFTNLVVLPPNEKFARDNENKEPKRNVTLILDTSGSMQGPSIKQAKSAIRQALYDLNEEDKFNVIQFNSYAEKLFMSSEMANGKNVQKALRWVDLLQATGGTQMIPALDLAFEEQRDQEYLNQIVFITDGAIGYESKLGNYIADRVGNARFFAVGIGSAPNTHLMQTIAERGRGSATFIQDVKRTKQKMIDLFAKMKKPALTNLELVGLSEGADVVPSVFPDLLYGQAFSATIRTPSVLNDLKLKANEFGDVWEQKIEMHKTLGATGVGKIYASRKIRDLKVRHGSDLENISQMTKLALDHQIVSEYTSLVAVDEKQIRPENATISSKRYHPNLPKGWQLAEFDPKDVMNSYKKLQDNKKSIALPKTDTGYFLQLIMGLLVLLIGVVLMKGMRQDAFNY